ncbi:MAG: hypothetical protein HY289_02015 [Planctomycetes bacterium]|nr:hypothetical protein [Planctomycetota bacterium]
MLRNWFMVPVLGSIALLCAVDMAQAQLRDRLSTLRERRMERRDMRRGVMVTPTTTTAPVMMTTGTGVARVSYYPTALSNSAQIRVIVPNAEARVMFDETLTKQVGTDRLFSTPALTGTANTYRIRVITTMPGGREVTLERVLNVAPNMTYVLDFTRR